MKNKTIILLAAALCAATSCRYDYNVLMDVCKVNLTSPSSDASFDLNTATENCMFTWTTEAQGEMTFVISRDENLVNPYYLPQSSDGCFTIDPASFDLALTDFGMSSGEEAKLYWSVKPSSDLEAASSQIGSFKVKRYISMLNYPADRSALALDRDNKEKECEFKWEYGGSSDLELVFSASPYFPEDNCYSYSCDSRKSLALTHSRLQELITGLSIDPYNTTPVYWNVKDKSTGEFISRASYALNLDGMLIFEDPRDGEVYKVAKVTYRDGETIILTAENHRGKLRTDGTPLTEKEFRQPTDENLTNKDAGKSTPVALEDCDRYRHVYGGYYSWDVRHDIAPKGWHLITHAEIIKLYSEATASEYGILSIADPVYMPAVVTDPDQEGVNCWGVGIVASGRFQWNKFIEFNQRHVNLYVAEMPDEYEEQGEVCIMQDCHGTLWYPTSTTNCPVRFAYGEK